MSKLIFNIPSCGVGIKVPAKPFDIVRKLETLRSETADPEYGLLSVLHRFSTSKVSLDRDRFYALKGLIKSREHSVDLPVDYAISAEAVFSAFAKMYISKYHTLNAFIRLD